MTTPTILSVDDSPDDLLLLILSCSSTKASFLLQTVESGEMAIAYLQGSDRFADRTRFPFPDLMLLDLKMPGISGFDVLSWIRRQPDTGQVPVVVFTSSMHEEDRARAFELGAKHYFVKPVTYEELEKFVRMIESLVKNFRPKGLCSFGRSPEHVGGMSL